MRLLLAGTRENLDHIHGEFNGLSWFELSPVEDYLCVGIPDFILVHHFVVLERFQLYEVHF